MKLQDFVNLCADEDILLTVIDDESSELLVHTWLSDIRHFDLYPDVVIREVHSYYHTKEGNNLIMEIYVK